MSESDNSIVGTFRKIYPEGRWMSMKTYAPVVSIPSNVVFSYLYEYLAAKEKGKESY